tara:strand:+ start:237 stop:644 length:408 start_codon:yes stop_codon:yes gene_type:complete
MAEIPLPPGLGPPAAGQQQNLSLRDNLSPLVQSPAEDFIAELMSIASELGILDEAFGPETVQDQADLQDMQSDPMEFLNEEQLTVLVQKFMAIEEPQRSEIAQQLKEALPPQVAQRLAAIIRFVEGRDAQQQVSI